MSPKMRPTNPRPSLFLLQDSCPYASAKTPKMNGEGKKGNKNHICKDAIPVNMLATPDSVDALLFMAKISPAKPSIPARKIRKSNPQRKCSHCLQMVKIPNKRQILVAIIAAPMTNRCSVE